MAFSYSNSHKVTKRVKAALACICGTKYALGWMGRPVPVVQMEYFTYRKSFSLVRKVESPAVDKLHLQTASVVAKRNSRCLFYAMFI